MEEDGETKKNADVFKPLDKVSEQRLKELWYDAPFGRDRIYALFKQKYPHDPTSRRAIFNWLTKQQLWQITVRPTASRGTVRPIVANKLGSVQIDYIDMTSNAYNGFNAALMCVDVFSKKMWSFPAKGQTVENTIKGMEKFLQDGLKVSFCQSDNGTSFLGAFPQWCRDHNIKLSYSKPHSPYSNGVVESKNSLFKKTLFRLMRARDDADWVSLTPHVLDQINNTITFATKKTPNQIEDDPALHGDVASMLQSTANKRYKTKGTASSLQVGDYVRRRKQYDPHGIVKGAKVGYWSDQIYQVERVVQNRKHPNIVSSYKIKDIQSNEVVSGLISRGELLHIPSPDQMEKIPKPVVRPGPVDDTHDEYEVESILDKKVTKATRGKPGTVLYKIKWKGWKKPTWEPLENIHAPDLIAAYEAAHH